MRALHPRNLWVVLALLVALGAWAAPTDASVAWTVGKAMVSVGRSALDPVMGGGGQADDQEKNDKEVKRSARHIRIEGNRIEADDGTVIEIKGSDVGPDIEDALREAEEALKDVQERAAEDRYTEHRSGIVEMGKDVVVPKDMVVSGDAVAVLSNLTVEGKVTGDAVAILGNLRLGDEAVVNGDAVSVLGSLNKADGARVRGQTSSVGGASNLCRWSGPHGPRFWFRGSVLGVLSLVSLGILVLLVVLISAVFREATDRIEVALRADVLKAWLIGLVMEVVLVVLTVVLVVTLIGIPLALLLWFVVGLAFLFGYAGVCLRVGEAMAGRRGGMRSRMVPLLLGLAVLLAVPILGRLLWIGGGFFWGPALGVRLLGSLISWFASTAGLGAVVMTRFGTRDARHRVPAPIPPPAAVSGPGPVADAPPGLQG